MKDARLRSAAVILSCLCLFFLGAAWAQEKGGQEKGEKKLEVKDLPKVVQATVQRESQGATIVGISAETEAGKTLYELETKVNGHGRDMLIDSKGTVVELEEEIQLGSLPAAVQAEVKKSIGKAQLVKLESVIKSGKMTGYSALVDNLGKQTEIEMGPDGRVPPKGK